MARSSEATFLVLSWASEKWSDCSSCARACTYGPQVRKYGEHEVKCENLKCMGIMLDNLCHPYILAYVITHTSHRDYSWPEPE